VLYSTPLPKALYAAQQFAQMLNFPALFVAIFAIPLSLTFFGLGSVLASNRKAFFGVLISGVVLAGYGVASLLITGLHLAELLLFVTPLYQVVLFQLALATFVKHAGRIPVNVALNFQAGLAKDRWFAMVVFMGGFAPPLNLFDYLGGREILYGI
jgi:hypothetical protein